MSLASVGAVARRNDATILASARAVFVADPDAPIAAVARHAGVGISSLYRRPVPDGGEQRARWQPKVGRSSR